MEHRAKPVPRQNSIRPRFAGSLPCYNNAMSRMLRLFFGLLTRV